MKESDMSDPSTVEPSPVRRKSLSKRLSLVRQHQNSDSVPQNGVEENNVIGVNGELEHVGESHQIRDYSVLEKSKEMLKKEKNDWSQLRQDLQKQYANAKKSCMETPFLTEESCSNLLSEEYRRFLNDRPDYDKIFQNYNTLVEMEAFTARNFEKMENATQEVLKKLLDHNKEKKNDAEKYVFSFD